MSKSQEKQSNPISTGNGGGTFENRVQAAITIFMLTDGSMAPWLPAWPIEKIKLQGRHAGYNTDDFIVFTKDPSSGKEAKLMAQIKRSISFTNGDSTFGEVIQAAWDDFNNPSNFKSGTDAIALITGCLSSSDINDVRPLMERARHCEDENEFLRNVKLPGFSSKGKENKLEVFRKKLTSANKGQPVTDKRLWEFLRSYHLIGFDLDVEAGSTLAMLLSLISKTSKEDPLGLWKNVVYAIQDANQNAGTVCSENIPDDILKAFNVDYNGTGEVVNYNLSNLIPAVISFDTNQELIGDIEDIRLFLEQTRLNKLVCGEEKFNIISLIENACMEELHNLENKEGYSKKNEITKTIIQRQIQENRKEIERYDRQVKAFMQMFPSYSNIENLTYIFKKMFSDDVTSGCSGIDNLIRFHEMEGLEKSFKINIPSEDWAKVPHSIREDAAHGVSHLVKVGNIPEEIMTKYVYPFFIRYLSQIDVWEQYKSNASDFYIKDWYFFKD